MDKQAIIMNFSAPPSIEDIEVITASMLEILPDELVDFAQDIVIQVEDFPDTAIEVELDLEDPYDLLALYRAASQISPGVERKNADGEDILMVFRRPVLDLWCETGEDLGDLIRSVMIEEIGQYHNFSESEIGEMITRHHQGLFIAG